MNYEFPRGAFSYIDKIFEIATSKVRDSTGASIDWDKAEERATGVVDRDANGRETTIFLKKKDKSGNPLKDTEIELGAGSVGSPAILMCSGKDLKGKIQNDDSHVFAS